MQIFKLIKKVFFLGLTILSNFTNALDCISMKNQECKVRSKIIVMILCFILLVLKWINVMVIVIILIIHMQEFVFLIL